VAYFLDTNILLRVVQSAHPMHAAAAAALARLTTDSEDLYLLPQNVREFWNVCTRPAERNGLGLPHAQVEAEVRAIEELFPVLEDGLPVYREWRRLVLVHQVSGVQVHDAYIAAAMRVHGVPNLLTFNTGDFARYGLNAVDPAAL
jgi:predicted nucleic acid-binding protein